jgi:hypothetical protein
MKQKDIEKAYQDAPALAVDNILLNLDEMALWKKCMQHAVLRCIVYQGGEQFKRFKADLAKSTPKSSEVLDLRKTELYPLPAMEIDESSLKGCIEANEARSTELEIPVSSDEDPEYARLQGGDQLTNSRNRSKTFIRLGHEVGINAWRHVHNMLGLFHVKMADTHGVIETHFGKPGSGSRNPTSLWFHNTLLDRIPITLTSLPTYRTCRDIVFVSLYGRLLHCLLMVSGHSTLEEYVEKVQSYEELARHGEMVYDQFVDTSVISDARERRAYAEARRNGEMMGAGANAEANGSGATQAGAKKKAKSDKQNSAPIRDSLPHRVLTNYAELRTHTSPVPG